MWKHHLCHRMGYLNSSLPYRTWCSAPNDKPQRVPFCHVTSRSASRRGAKPNRARARARPPRAGRVRVVERHATVTGQIAPSVPGGPQSAPNLFVALEAPTTPTRRTAGRCRRSTDGLGHSPSRRGQSVSLLIRASRLRASGPLQPCSVSSATEWPAGRRRIRR